MQNGGGFFPVSGTVQRSGPEAGFLCTESVEGSFCQKDRLVSQQQFRLKQRRRNAFFVQVFLSIGGTQDEPAFFTRQYDAFFLGVVAEPKAVDCFRRKTPVCEVARFFPLGVAVGEIGFFLFF